MESSTSGDPSLTSSDGVSLPGSAAFYAYKNVNHTWEALDNLIWTRGRHLVTVGGGVLWRSSNGYLTAGQDGEYMFPSVLPFALDEPNVVEAAVNRVTLPSIQQPTPTEPTDTARISYSPRTPTSSRPG